MQSTSLLVSFQSRSELESVAGDLPDWIDLKAPAAGPLGCPSLPVARDFLEEVKLRSLPLRPPVSMAIGELTEQAWRQVLPIANEYDFVKIALAQCQSAMGWESKLEQIPVALGMPARVIVTYYADRHLAHAPSWPATLAAAKRLASPYILIDTFDKQAGRLWDWYSREEIREFAAAARRSHIDIAIAGSMQLDELAEVSGLGISVIGVRGAVCENGSRVKAIDRDRLRQALKFIRHKESEIA